MSSIDQKYSLQYQLNPSEEILAFKIHEQSNLQLAALLTEVARTISHLIKRKVILHPSDAENMINRLFPFIQNCQLTFDITPYETYNSNRLQHFFESPKFQAILHSRAQKFGIGALPLKSKKIIVVVICSQLDIQFDSQRFHTETINYTGSSDELNKNNFLAKINKFRLQHRLPEIKSIQPIDPDHNSSDVKVYTVSGIPNNIDDDFLFCISKPSFADFILLPIIAIDFDAIHNENSSYDLKIKFLLDYQSSPYSTPLNLLEEQKFDSELIETNPNSPEQVKHSIIEPFSSREEPADDEDLIEEEESDDSDSNLETNPTTSEIENKEEIEEEESDDDDDPNQEINPTTTENEVEIENKEEIEEEESDDDDDDPNQEINPTTTENEIELENTDEIVNIAENKDEIEEEESDDDDPNTDNKPITNEIDIKVENTDEIKVENTDEIENQVENENKDEIEEEESDDDDEPFLNTTNNNIISFNKELNESKEVIDKSTVVINPNHEAQIAKHDNTEQSLDIPKPQLDEQTTGNSIEIAQPKPKIEITVAQPTTPEDCIKSAIQFINQNNQRLTAKIDQEISSKLQTYLEECNSTINAEVSAQKIKIKEIFSPLIPHYKGAYIMIRQNHVYLRGEIKKIDYTGNVIAIACTRALDSKGNTSAQFNFIFLIQDIPNENQNTPTQNKNQQTTPNSTKYSNKKQNTILNQTEIDIVHQLDSIDTKFEVIEEYTPQLRKILQENTDQKIDYEKAKIDFPSVSAFFLRSYIKFDYQHLIKTVRTEFGRFEDKLSKSIVGVGAICDDENGKIYSAAVFTGRRMNQMTPNKYEKLSSSHTPIKSYQSPNAQFSHSQQFSSKSTPKSGKKQNAMPSDFQRSHVIIDKINEYRHGHGLPNAVLNPSLLKFAMEYTQKMGRSHIMSRCDEYVEQARNDFPEYKNILAYGICKNRDNYYIDSIFKDHDPHLMKILNSRNENVSIGFWNDAANNTVTIGIFSWTTQ